MDSTTSTMRISQDFDVMIQELNHVVSRLDKVADDFREYDLVLARMEQDVNDHHLSHLTIENCQSRRILLGQLRMKIGQADEELLWCTREIKRISDAVHGFS